MGDKTTETAAQSNLTRRTFLRGALGVAVAGASAGALSACGAQDAGSSSETQEKVIRFGIANPKATFDTQLTSNTWGASENICDTLIRLNPDTKELEPVLLTALPEVSDDGLTYSFELKDGVKFHDGSTLTSEDVRYTMTRVLAKQAQSDGYDKIEGAKAVVDGSATELSGFTVQDDRHFSITLSEVYSSFSYLLAQFYASIYPHEACEAAGDAWGTGTNFIGCGPFKLESNDDSTEVVLTAFEDYHDGKPAIDRVEIHYIDDGNTLMMNYINNDIDLCFIDKSLLDQYKEDDSVADQIVYYKPAATQFLNLNLNDANFQDIRVREALSLAINRQELCDTILSGAASPCTGFIPESDTGHDDAGEVLEYDPDRARELLQEAGATDLHLTAQVRSQDQAVMVAIQNYWQQVGVTCDVQVIDAGLWRESRSNGSLLLTLVTWSTLSFVGVEHMASYFRSDKASTRSSFYNSADFDAYVDAARSSMDKEAQLENTVQADCQLVRKDFGTIPLVWPENPYVLRKGYEGLELLVDPHFRKVTLNA
ncbi:MAG: ABC transporter substrate-binding protein [Atopobiaceae bacterium]|jgi:ABC-type transport system substrate-binding protein